MMEFKDVQEALSYARILAKPIIYPDELSPLSLYKQKPKDLVVGGDPVRTPIDRVAARVVSPAPEWAKPPPPPATKDERPSIRLKQMKHSEDDLKNNALRSQGVMPDSGKLLVSRKKDADFNVELTAKSVEVATQKVVESENLVRRAEEAAAAMEYLVNHVPVSWIQYRDYMLQALRDARATKVAIEIETKQTLAALADIRKFFLDSRHEEEVQRLKEFVTLCERLRDLRDSGFLDTVCDTILRLEKL
jgi:hypothetical protein